LETVDQLTSEDAERLSVELERLSRSQAEALQKSPYLFMSRQEREVYDRRRTRIARIQSLLAKCLPEAPSSIET
jgi:hypothetical protein